MNPKVRISKDRQCVWINGHKAKKIISSCRDIFVYGKFVVKLDKTDHIVIGKRSWLNNQSSRELRRYKKIKPEDLKYFPKVYGGEISRVATGWIVEERLKIKSRAGRPNYKVFDEVMKIVVKYKFADDFGANRYNWTIINGQPIIYDWGC